MVLAFGRLVAVLVLLAGLQAFGESKPGLLHSAPAQAKGGEALQVDGSLVGSQTFEKIVLRFRGPGQDYVDARMELQYGDLYRGFVPASRMVAPGVEYYVEGLSKGGDRVPLFMTASRPARVIVLADESDRPEASAVATEEKATGKRSKKKKKGEKLSAEKVATEKASAEKAAPDRAFEEEPPAAVERPESESVERGSKAEPESSPEPARSDKRSEQVARAEPEHVEAPSARTARSEQATTEPAPARKRGSMEDELSLYTAEYAPGLVPKLEESTRRSPQHTVVLTAAQLKAQGARTVYDALDLVPGLAVSRTVQGFYRVAVRGFRAEPEVLFLIDGHKLNAFYDGRALSNLPVENFERIEVLLGPAPAAVDAQSFAAVVNLVPNREDGLRVAFTPGLNSVPNTPPSNPQAPPAPGQKVDERGVLEGHLNGALHAGAVKLFVDADVIKQNGYYKPIPIDGLKLASPAGYTDDHRVMFNVGAGLSYSSKKLGTLTASARILQEDRAALVGQFDAVGPGSKLTWQTILADVTLDRALTESATLSLHASFDQQATDRLFRQTPPNFKTSAKMNNLFPEGITENQRGGERTFALQGASLLTLPANNQLQVGLKGEFRALTQADYLVNFTGDLNDQYAGPALTQAHDVTSPLDLGAGAASRRVQLSLFAADEWKPIDRFTLQAGLRFDLTQLPTADAATNQITGAAFLPSLSPRLALAFAPLDNLVVKASYGRGFRAPTAQEFSEQIPNSNSNQGRFVGNPSVQAEFSDVVEGSVEFLHSLGDVRARVVGGGYYQKLTLPIMPIDTTGNLVPIKNRPDGAQSYGLTGEARLEFLTRGAAWVNLSWVRAEDLGTVPTARLLTDTPQLRANAGLSIPIGPWVVLDAFARVHSERRNDSRSVLELVRRYRLAPYALVGGQVRTELLFDHLELAFLVQNLFDAEFADDVPRPDRIPGGVPREGVTAFLTLRLSL